MEINNFVKVMYNEVYSIPTSLEKPKKEVKEKREVKDTNLKRKKPNVEDKKPNVEDKKPNVEDKKPNIEEKKPNVEEKKPKSEVRDETDITLMNILNTVDYTIEGIEKLYSHERYKYKEDYRKRDFEKINYHRSESCGADNNKSIYSSMRDNNILCEYHDYIDKDLIIKILSPLGLDELKNKFIKNGIDSIKSVIEVTDGQLKSLGLNDVDIVRFRNEVKNIIFTNRVKVFESRKKACNCEYERFLKNMVYRDRFSEVEQGHIKPFKEARDMCERCFKFEQELLKNGYIEEKMSERKTIEYINQQMYEKVENAYVKNKYKLLKKDDKLNSAIDDVWFNKSHPKGFKRSISYEDFRDRIQIRDIKERQLEIRDRLKESVNRLIDRKKRKTKIMDELYNINRQKKKLIGIVENLREIVDKYRRNKELYIELRRNGKVTGIDVDKDLKDIENYIDITIPKIMKRYSLLNNLKIAVKN